MSLCEGLLHQWFEADNMMQQLGTTSKAGLSHLIEQSTCSTQHVILQHTNNNTPLIALHHIRSLAK